MPSMETYQSLDTPLVKVPYDSLRRTVRDRKHILEGVKGAVASINASADNESLRAEHRVVEIDKVISKLTRMKRKLTETGKLEEEDANRCVFRIRHLVTLGQPPPGQYVLWNKKRLTTFLLDHLLRSGYHLSASYLASETGMQEVVDSVIFSKAQSVVAALKSQDCSAALAWCVEHRSRLTKNGSNFEFKLRVQEFIELVRMNDKMKAISYAQQYLAPWAATEMHELQRAMAALCFQPDTDCFPYMVFFDQLQWDILIDLFLQELYRLNSLTPTSLLQIHLQAGISALKTPISSSDNHNKEDPLSLPHFRDLAMGLPIAKHGRSKLVCCITKEMMNEHNPPMVMPNGYVYSQKAISQIVARNDGEVVCPITGERCTLSALKRAYLA